jgi:hypothetical protein
MPSRTRRAGAVPNALNPSTATKGAAIALAQDIVRRKGEWRPGDLISQALLAIIADGYVRLSRPHKAVKPVSGATSIHGGPANAPGQARGRGQARPMAQGSSDLIQDKAVHPSADRVKGDRSTAEPADRVRKPAQRATKARKAGAGTT